MTAAVASARDRDLKPLTEGCSRELGLDRDQLATVSAYLDDAWFFGIRVGHAVMAETKLGRVDPKEIVHGTQAEFQDLMEDCADALNTTVGVTIAVWGYLGRAWMAGAKFWEVEIAARLIEASSDGFEEELRRFEE